MYKSILAKDAIKVVESGDRVFIHSAACAPQVLIDALVDRADELRDVEIVHIHTESEAPYTKPEYSDSFTLRSFFVGGNVRKATQEGRADYIPIFLGEVPGLFRKGIMPLDVALVQVSPPDKHGYCSLGPSVDVTLAAIETAGIVVAVVNPFVPRAHGDAMVHISRLDYLVDDETPLPELHSPEVGDIEREIGEYCASLVENGSTIQMGIGAIPNATLIALENHKRLGVHTEMFSDGLVPLVEKGVITGEEKKVLPNKVVSGFVVGTKRVFDFIDDNPGVIMKDTAYTNDVATIRRNPKVVAINSAIEVDFTGQVCADSIGMKQYSGVGGQIDFIRGASYSEGGKPIIALPSRTRRGESKIVQTLRPGAGVVSTRANIHYIVTEYGIAYLYGKSMMQRAAALINIAHPEDRETLEKQAYERFGTINMKKYF